MAWANSDRNRRLPPDWTSVRNRRLQRDRYQCQLRWRGCLGKATDVDHKVAGDDHSWDNLQSVCRSCHEKKSAAEGVAQRRELRARRKRPTDRHPGSR